MPVPTIDPYQRDPAEVSPTDSYQPAEPVWVHRGGTWCAGVVETVSPRAVTVTYRLSNARGTGVDTITGQYVLPRADGDLPLDHGSRTWDAGPARPGRRDARR